MDFNKYYLDQASGRYPVFRGSVIQRGYGLGNVFRQLLSWAIPILKEHALPLVKEVGKEVIHNVAGIANDAIEGRNIKESAKEKFKTSLQKLQRGNGIQKRKKKRITKKIKDIFSSSWNAPNLN